MDMDVASQNNPLLEALRGLIGERLDDLPSPLGVWLSGTLRAIESDGLEVAYTVRPEMTNPAQVLHGGIAAAIMDELIGATVYVFNAGRYHASINLAVDFLAPARIGDTIIARSRIARQGRRLVNADCTLHSEGGHLIARATSNLLAVDI